VKAKIKIAYSDTWGFTDRTPEGVFPYEFNPHDNYFTDLFKTKFDVEVVDSDPDLLIYGVYGNTYKNFNCKKILFSGENLNASKGCINHYDDSDLTLSHYEEEDKEIFMPLWVLFVNWFRKTQPRPLPSNPTYSVDFDLIQNNRERFLKERKFCAFINNNQIADRIELFQELHEKEHVDSFGYLLNNTGKALRGSQQDKIKLLENYRFNIAFENCYHKGYNTEKIIEPLESGCIPLYKGGERVLEYFNEKSFLFYENYNDMSSFAKAVLDVHQNNELYEDIVLTKPLRLDNIYKDFSPDVLLSKILSKLNL